MTVVMLAAGTSSRMGRVNKLLLDVNGLPMVSHCCLQALQFLDTLDESSKLIVVVGYRSRSTIKALSACKDFVSNSKSRIQMVIVENKNYRQGQFSSAKAGIAEVPEDSDFILGLCDMPKLTSENFAVISKSLGKSDAVRPVVNSIPGHPVLLASFLRDVILKQPNDCSVKKVLASYKVKELPFADSSWITDIDTL